MRDGKVYAQLPYNSYNTNIDTAIAGAYYLGRILYPAAFDGVEPEQKADKIYQVLGRHDADLGAEASTVTCMISKRTSIVKSLTS